MNCATRPSGEKEPVAGGHIGHASADPDVDVSIQALETLRNIRMGDLGKLLRSRLDEAKRSGDSAGAIKLAEEEEKHFKRHLLSM